MPLPAEAAPNPVVVETNHCRLHRCHRHRHQIQPEFKLDCECGDKGNLEGAPCSA